MSDWPQPWEADSGAASREDADAAPGSPSIRPLDAGFEETDVTVEPPELDEAWSLEPSGLEMEELLEAAEQEPVPEPAKPDAGEALQALALSLQEPGPEPSSPEPDPTLSNHIAFRIADAVYAVSMEHVLELDRITPITPVPNTPDFVLGVTNLHGDITSVIDLRRLLGLPPANRLDHSRLIKLRNASGSITTGAVVDAVQGMRSIPAERLENRPAGGADGWTRRYESEGETIEIVDVDRLLESEPMRRLTGV